MSQNDALLLIGTASTAGMALLNIWIARINGFRKYGKDAALIWAVTWIFVTVVRGLRHLGILDADDALLVNGIGFTAAFLLLVQLLVTVRSGQH